MVNQYELKCSLIMNFGDGLMQDINYNNLIYKTYEKARKLSPETFHQWMKVVLECIDRKRDITVLDIGCGTGRFSPLLADFLDARVFGVEPSDKMRAVAEKENSHPRVEYMEGTAENNPLDDESCDVVWASMIIHHVSNLGSVVKEFYRVLKPEGFLLIRNSFKNRLGKIPFFKFFPTAYEIENERLPNINSVRKICEKNGFSFKHLRTVEQVIDRNFVEYAKRIEKKGLSVFELISDEEFTKGINLMKKAALEEDPKKPVIEKLDLLVFSK